SWLGAFPSAEAVAYGAATFEESALLQLLDVWPPGIVMADRIVVHQKDVLGHFDLPILLRLRSKHYRLARGSPIHRGLADSRSSKYRDMGGSTEPFPCIAQTRTERGAVGPGPDAGRPLGGAANPGCANSGAGCSALQGQRRTRLMVRCRQNDRRPS